MNTTNIRRRLIRMCGAQLLIVSLTLNGPVFGQNSRSPEALRVTVLEGDNATNKIQDHTGTDLIVHVQDASGVPVSGAEVTFRLPQDGPSGEFQGSTKTATVLTDSQGLAASSGLRPNAKAGDFRIEVMVRSGGASTQISIKQTNEGAGKSGGKTLIIVGAVAGGVGVALAASHHSTSTQPPVPPVTITAGQPTLGAPQFRRRP